MKLTIHPDGRREIEGEPLDVREFLDAQPNSHFVMTPAVRRQVSGGGCAFCGGVAGAHAMTCPTLRTGTIPIYDAYTFWCGGLGGEQPRFSVEVNKAPTAGRA